MLRWRQRQRLFIKNVVIISIFVATSPARGGGGWVEEDKMVGAPTDPSDGIGGDVAIFGDTAVFGATGDDQLFASNCGAAYVFIRDGSDWLQQAKLLAPDYSGGDFFGDAVAIFGDTVIIGAPSDDLTGAQDGGSAHVYVRTGSVWTFQQKLTANDAGQNDLFGTSVALDGDTAVIGSFSDDNANGLDAGSAYVFVRSGTNWTQQAKLLANDGVVSDWFGRAVSISGNTIIAGAEAKHLVMGEQTEFYAGAAYVFVRSGATWTQQAKLIGSQTNGFDEFGFSVAISGETALVGSRYDDIPFDQFNNAGTAYVFVRSGSVWTEQARLNAPDFGIGHEFGFSVALDGNAACIGAIGHTGGSYAGSAYIFERSGTSWSMESQLFPGDPDNGAMFGRSVGLSGDAAIVGVPFADTVPGMNGPGAAYVFRAGGQAGCCRGDMNGSGQVQAADVSPFVTVVLSGSGTPAEVCAADVNADAAIDGRDVHAFVTKVTSGGSCP